MAPAASATTKGEEKDDETDLYVPSPPNIPFTVNQLYTTLHATGPRITEFPIPVQALMDIGCPCTVINAELCDRLGLRRYLLPMSENNLSSLSQTPLNCEEYVKLELQLGKGTWKSGVHKMKVNKGLPFPIILGMPWLSSEHILIDSHERTAIDKRTRYDLLNPPPLIARAPTAPRTTPLPTPKEIRAIKPPTLEETGTPTLAGYLLPGPIMAAVRGRIEDLTFQETLKAEDAKTKLRYADQFPTLPTMSLDTCSTASASKTPPRSIMAKSMRLPRNIKNLGKNSWMNICNRAAFGPPPLNTLHLHSVSPNIQWEFLT